MRMGADRMCMPAPTVEQFVVAVKMTVLANRRWVPPPDKGFLYIRPLLMGSGAVLSLIPASEFIFLVFVTPVANLLRILKAQTEAKADSFFDVLYLDSVHKRYLEEASTTNFFVVKDKIISTPPLGGTVTPGVTRKSVIEIARGQGFQVEGRHVSVDELFKADEVFFTGNSVCLLPVSSITFMDKRVFYGETGFGQVSEQLYLALSSLQMGLTEDTMGWTVTLK